MQITGRPVLAALMLFLPTTNSQNEIHLSKLNVFENLLIDRREFFAGNFIKSHVLLLNQFEMIYFLSQALWLSLKDRRKDFAADFCCKGSIAILVN